MSWQVLILVLFYISNSAADVIISKGDTRVEEGKSTREQPQQVRDPELYPMQHRGPWRATMEGPRQRPHPPCGFVSVLRPGMRPSSPSVGNPRLPCHFARGPFNGPMMGGAGDVPGWMHGLGPHMGPGEMMVPPSNAADMVEMMRGIAPLMPSTDLMQQHMEAVNQELLKDKQFNTKLGRSEVGEAMVEHMKQVNYHMAEQLRAEEEESARVTRWVIYVLVPAALLAVMLLCVLLCLRRRRQAAGYSTMSEFERKSTA